MAIPFSACPMAAQPVTTPPVVMGPEALLVFHRILTAAADWFTRTVVHDVGHWPGYLDVFRSAAMHRHGTKS